MTFLSMIPVAGFCGCSLVAALSDARTLRISNSLSLAILALFGTYAAATLTLAMTATALGLATVALVFGFAAFSRGWLGGGDAKLFAVCMAWAGLPHAAEFLAVTGIAGGIVALALRAPLTAPIAGRVRRDWPGSPSEQRASMPYGVAIAAGALAVAAELLAQ